jgi:glyoxylase-like metal-dependent hydrolase (beta-lactamase superfamily II)
MMSSKLIVSNTPRKIAPRVYSIGQRKGGNVHAFLIDSEQGLILIDALFDTDGAPVIAAIEAIGAKVGGLKHIIVTHAHRSHIGGLAALKKRSGAKVWSHEWEADIVAGERPAQPVPLFPRRPLQVYHLQFGLALGLMPHEHCEVDAFLRSGDNVGPLQVIHTPGHSPGHLSFYWPEQRVLFVGDALVTWPRLALGWPGLNLNHKQHRRTLYDLVDIDASVIAVGHGEPAVDEDVEILRRMILQT